MKYIFCSVNMFTVKQNLYVYTVLGDRVQGEFLTSASVENLGEAIATYCKSTGINKVVLADALHSYAENIKDTILSVNEYSKNNIEVTIV